MILGRLVKTYLFLGLASVAFVPLTVLGQSVPADDEPTATTQPTPPAAPKKWQKKKKKKPTILQSWKKVLTGDWASLNKYDNRNLTMSAVALGAAYTFYYYCLRSAPVVNQQNNGQRNQQQHDGEDNNNPLAIRPEQPVAIPLIHTVIEQHRIKLAEAVPQGLNALCGVYSAHNADAALTFIRNLDRATLNNDTIDGTLVHLNQHLSERQDVLEARLQANPGNNNDQTNWTAQVCHSRKYNIYKRAFFTCIYNGLAQVAQERKRATQTAWEKFMSLFFSNTPLVLQQAEKEAVSRIADVFTQHLIRGNTINFDTLDAATFKAIYEQKLRPLDDPDAQRKYGVDNTLTAYNNSQQVSQDIALQQAVRDSLKEAFGASATNSAQLAQQLKPYVKGTNLSDDLSGNNLDSGEVTQLLDSIDRTYTILAEDAANGTGRDVIEALKAETPEAFDTSYKITVIDKTNANQAGYYRQALNEVRTAMYSKNEPFAHAFLIRLDTRAAIKVGDDTTQTTAALSADRSTHWTTLVVLRIPSGTTMINHYIAIDSMNGIALNHRSHQDIIEILEHAPVPIN
jgi:hypothetical protein